MNYKKTLINEYKELNKSPVFVKLGNIELIVPAFYNDKDEFLDDLFSFQDTEHLKYERYNRKNPQNQIYPKSLKINDIHIIVPLSMAKAGASNKEIVKSVFKRAYDRYIDAINKTKRLNNEYPEEQSLVKLTDRHILYCHSKHMEFILKNITTTVGKKLKWSAKQVSDVAIGLASSPLFATYKLLDKKYHFGESKFSHFIDSELAPKFKKMLFTTILGFSMTLADKPKEKNGKPHEVFNIGIFNKKENESEKLRKKYKITDQESFDELYSNAFPYIIKSLMATEIFVPTSYSDNGKDINTVGLGSYYYPKDGDPTSSKWITTWSYVKKHGAIDVDGPKSVLLVDGWFRYREHGRAYKSLYKSLYGAEINIPEFVGITDCYYNNETHGKEFAKFVCKNYDKPNECIIKLMSLTPNNKFKVGIEKRHLHEALIYLNFNDYAKELSSLQIVERERKNGSKVYASSITQLDKDDCSKFKLAIANNDSINIGEICKDILNYSRQNSKSVQQIYDENNMSASICETPSDKKTCKFTNINRSKTNSR